MYINDINIIYYVIVGVVGLVVGQFVDWCNKRLPEYKKVFSKEFFTIYLPTMKIQYLLVFSTAIIYVLLLYFIGWGNIISKLDLIKYMILTPMLLSAFVIDYRLQIIPNRLNLTIFEVGLIFTFIQGMYNPQLALSLIQGGLLGAGIFLIITLLGGLIAGKEAMGFGDVKFMGALGLFFGWMDIISVSILSFFLAAIISIFLIATKIRKSDEYIPFGPFIVMACIVVMLLPEGTVIYEMLRILDVSWILRK